VQKVFLIFILDSCFYLFKSHFAEWFGFIEDKESVMTVINLESKTLANWTQAAGPVKTTVK
jgi:hypothetical protein